MLCRVLTVLEPSIEQCDIINFLSSLDFAISETMPNQGDIFERATQSNFDVFIASSNVFQTYNDPEISSGFTILRELPERPFIVIIQPGENPDLSARLLALGADSVIPMNVELSVLHAAVEDSISRQQHAKFNMTLQKGRKARLDDFVSRSKPMQNLVNIAKKVSTSDTSLLILGETGVGKEHLARAIHNEGPRRNAGFFAINCGALPENLLESELFGHEKGAFTGATRSRRGAFELAHGGTLFLDEIAEIPLHLQVKLLRVLQDQEIRRVGGETSFNVSVRVIAATNKNLEEEIRAKQFRQDLYYRLSVVTLVIPPLSQRRPDIPTFCRLYLDYYRKRLSLPVEGFSKDAMALLLSYDWPGNIRELMNVIERALLLCNGSLIEADDLMISHTSIQNNDDDVLPLDFDMPYHSCKKKILDAFDSVYLNHWLKKNNGQITATAKKIGIDPRSMYTKMRQLKISKYDFKGE